MDGGGTEYADHEVQVLTLRGANGADDQSNQGELDEIKNFEPVSERGIDSDELGELVAMFRTASINLRDFTGLSTDEVGSVHVEGDLGANLQDGELPSQVTNNPTAESDPTKDLLYTTGNYSEPGVFDTFKLSAEPAFADVTNGIAGTGDQSGSHSERFINFRDNFGTGPFLDRTDDLSGHIEVEFNNFQTDATLDVEIKYFLYWAVEEMPECRASFSRP